MYISSDQLIRSANHMSWLCACTHCRESLGQMRALLQRGLETIRLVGHGGLDVDLVVHLACTFAYRVRKYIYDFPN